MRLFRLQKEIAISLLTFLLTKATARSNMAIVISKATGAIIETLFIMFKTVNKKNVSNSHKFIVSRYNLFSLLLLTINKQSSSEVEDINNPFQNTIVIYRIFHKEKILNKYFLEKK